MYDVGNISTQDGRQKGGKGRPSEVLEYANTSSVPVFLRRQPSPPAPPPPPPPRFVFETWCEIFGDTVAMMTCSLQDLVLVLYRLRLVLWIRSRWGMGTSGHVLSYLNVTWNLCFILVYFFPHLVIGMCPMNAIACLAGGGGGVGGVGDACFVSFVRKFKNRKILSSLLSELLLNKKKAGCFYCFVGGATVYLSWCWFGANV